MLNPITRNSCLMLLLIAFIGCGQQSGTHDESRAAKDLLQGVWTNEETETPVFKMEGDSVYYPDTVSMTAYFKVVDDTLYIGSTARYYIEKQTSHHLWFRHSSGELVKLVKADDEADEEIFEQTPPRVLTLTEVLKRDTVVFYQDKRYHLYVAINPTKYKVSRYTVNEDGMEVENVYYDNIIHLSIFQGDHQLFSSDFRKKQYQPYVPEEFLDNAILNDIQLVRTDDNGFHLLSSLCVPDDASSYQVEHVVAFSGALTTQKLKD